ncbi:GNAT family N-acetyltransferase [Novosphingobium flavum]|uniref:GNAT family N-acetyltransferase n=1 Tax=Novosphingobium aerophilum TaxID=2839843 RepID=UPI001639DE52|nr:GNAT family N-acetyltransferase [Novosphingobium aerophilum]MBC2663804.1 GNAT family N-acetyltransferase [Novosphingobium aerophilum]
MIPVLFDPGTAGYADTDDPALRYLHALASIGLDKLVPNVRTRIMGLRSGGRVFPVTINDGEHGGSYVCEPYSAYILYARRELEIIGAGLERWLFLPVIAGASVLLRAARINQIVHVNNWLLSTNLHGDWQGADIGDIRRFLTHRYPRHIIAVRSLDRWSSPSLIEAAIRDGWILFPSRQIWVIGDVAAQWQRRHSLSEDRRVLRRSGLTVERLESIGAADAERIAQLYAMLYLEKYSALNPAFTARWVIETARAGLIHYRCARDADGVIMAVSGSLRRGDVLTPPVVGYDTAKPRSLGLYRVASLLFTEDAKTQGVRLNGSAGAAGFKRLRGARAETEFSAYYVAHLPLVRRAILKLLSDLLNRIAVPYMRKHQL